LTVVISMMGHFISGLKHISKKLQDTFVDTSKYVWYFVSCLVT